WAAMPSRSSTVHRRRPWTFAETLVRSWLKLVARSTTFSPHLRSKTVTVSLICSCRRDLCLTVEFPIRAPYQIGPHGVLSSRAGWVPWPGLVHPKACPFLGVVSRLVVAVGLGGWFWRLDLTTDLALCRVRELR